MDDTLQIPPVIWDMEKPWFLKGNYLQMVGFPYLCQIIEEYVIGNSVNQFAECWNWNEVKHKLTKITERNENIWLFILKNMVPLNPLGNHHAHYQKNPQYNLVGIPHVSTKPYLNSSIIMKFFWTVAFSAPELTFFSVARCTGPAGWRSTAMSSSSTNWPGSKAASRLAFWWNCQRYIYAIMIHCVLIEPVGSVEKVIVS